MKRDKSFVLVIVAYIQVSDYSFCVNDYATEIFLTQVMNACAVSKIWMQISLYKLVWAQEI